MPNIARRQVAPLIRIRQEVEKRLDALVPWGLRAHTLRDVLVPDVANRLEADSARDSDALRRSFAAAAATRFPLAHLAKRPVSELPARAELEAEVAAVMRGNWSVFGTPVTVNPREHDWTRHPVSGVRPVRKHWSRVAYMNGVGGGDVKVIWELSRHQQLLRLAQGYFLDRNEERAETILVLLDQWIEQNPHGRGINWTSSLEVAFRAIAWCWIWALTCESRSWTAVRTTRFLVSLWHHARHVERFDSIHHSPNTHLTGEGLGLVYVGLMFPELSRAEEWKELGRDILETELRAQVLDDGMHFERATGYHRYTAEFYLHYLVLADGFGLEVSADSRARVRAQVHAAALLRRPDGTWPVIGDEDSGDTLLLSPHAAQDQGPVLAIGAALFNDASVASLASDVHRSAGWWLLDDAAWRAMREQAVRPAPTTPNAVSGALPSAGYFVARDGQGAEDWWCLVDAGPHGGDRTGHAHTDLGHVEIAHGNEHLVVDPGCAGYTIERARRDLARSEAAHACVVVDGMPLAAPSGAFSWSTVAPTPNVRHGDEGSVWWCELSYDRGGPSRRVSHRRQVVLVRGRGVVVCDWLEADAPIAFAAHWPLGDAIDRCTLAGTSITAGSHVISWSGSGAQATLEPIRRSPGYGRECDSHRLRLSHAGTRTASLVTCFSDVRRPLVVHAHDDSMIQITLAGDLSDGASLVVIAPGKPVTIERVPAPVTSSHVVR